MSGGRKGLRPVIGVALGLCLLCILSLGYDRYVQVRGHFISGLGHLWTLQNMAGREGNPQDWERLIAGLAQAEGDFRAVQEALAPLLFLGRYFGWLPVIGGDIEAAPHLLQIAIDASGAAGMALESLEALPDLRATDVPRENLGQSLLETLVAGRPTLEQAQAKLERVAEERHKIEASRLSPRLARQVESLDSYLLALNAAVRGALLAPELLGASQLRTYLLLTQNNHELRATGGFVSGAGLVSVYKGRIIGLTFKDSYAIDDLSRPHPPPPEPLRRYMGAGLLVFRDANWSPDFPTTARVVESIYQVDQGVALDGVVAVDLAALQGLIEAIGPVALPAYGQQVDGGNVLALLKRYWQTPLAAPSIEAGTDSGWWEHRKDFMADLLGAIVTKLESESGTISASKLLLALKRQLDEKHVLIYLHDQDAARLLAENNWDGRLRSADGDYLLVVDSNLGYNKVNPNVEEGIEYRISVGQDGSFQSQATVTYFNRSARETDQCVHASKYGDSYDELMQGCYWDYLRLYVPQGSRLVEAQGVDEPVEVSVEGDKRVFATFFVLAPGEEKQISFSYSLPPDILQEGRYSLLVQKQAGTLNHPLDVTLELPGEVARAEPVPLVEQDNVLKYQTHLLKDQTFTVASTPPGASRPQKVLNWLVPGGLALLGIGLALRFAGRLK
jgi:hypothetical protein